MVHFEHFEVPSIYLSVDIQHPDSRSTIASAHADLGIKIILLIAISLYFFSLVLNCLWIDLYLMSVSKSPSLESSLVGLVS